MSEGAAEDHLDILNADEEVDDELRERLDRLFAKEQITPALHSPIGQEVGKYLIEESLGHGSFGVVYRALDTQLNRLVALKLPRPEVLVDAHRLERFQAEAATAASLDHPAIVPIYEAELTGLAPYIASALCNGPDLRQWIDNRLAPPAPGHAAAFVADLADAVHYAHEHGVLHRDLKPANVLLEPHDHTSKTIDELPECVPRLTDFGLARMSDEGLSQTRSSMLVGTPLYMAPERLAENRNDSHPAIDIYSLGVMLYELLTLRTPFEGTTYIEVLDKLRSGDSESLRRVNPAAPRALETISNKCLALEPNARYASAGELRDDLRRYLDGEAIHAKRASTWERFRRWTRQPERIVQAGMFTFWYQIAVTVWMAAVGIIAMATRTVPEELLRTTATDVLFISASFHLPLAVIGWLIARGERWTFWWGAVGSITLVGMLAHSAIEPAVSFEYHYSTPLSRLNMFVALMLGALTQLSLYAIALPAWFRRRKPPI